MTQHTKGSHCPADWSMTAGSWWSDPCYCDRVQSLNQNAIGAGGAGQQWFGTVTINPSANAAAAPPPITQTFTWPTTGDAQVWYPINPAPIHIHYCQHEEVNKHLLELIKILIEKLEAKK